MRTTYLALAFLMTLSFSVEAQTIVEWDFQSGAIKTYKGSVSAPNTHPVRLNEFVTVRVINVNTFKYEVTVKGSNVDLSTPIPSELQTIFRLPKEEEEEKIEITDAVAKTKAEAAKMDALSTAITPPGDDSDLDSKMTTLSASCKALISTTAEIAQVRIDRMILISLVQQEWGKHKSLKDAMFNAGIRPRKRLAMRTSYESFIKDYEKVEADYDKASKRAGVLLDNAKVVAKKSKAIANSAGASNADKAKAVTDSAEVDKLKGIKNEIDTAKSKIHDAYEVIESDEFLQIIEDIFTLETAINNEDNFTVVSGPLQMQGDFANFKVSAIPRKVNALLPIVTGKTTNFDIPTVGGWKADFSVGPTMAFGDGAKDELFFLEPGAGDTTVTLISTENKNVIRPGLAALMHFYTRKGRDRALGFAFGVGAEFKTIDDPDLSLYLGGSWVLGKSRKVMVSAGFSFLRVDRLQSQYEVDQVFAKDVINLDAVTSKVFKTAPFISVSYNITNRSEFN